MGCAILTESSSTSLSSLPCPKRETSYASPRWTEYLIFIKCISLCKYFPILDNVDLCTLECRRIILTTRTRITWKYFVFIIFILELLLFTVSFSEQINIYYHHSNLLGVVRHFKKYCGSWDPMNRITKLTVVRITNYQTADFYADS